MPTDIRYRILDDDETIQRGDCYSTYGIDSSSWQRCTNSVGYTSIEYKRQQRLSDWIVKRPIVATPLGNIL